MGMYKLDKYDFIMSNIVQYNLFSLPFVISSTAPATPQYHAQQQQAQYPSYQSPADNMYSMGGDQHGLGMGGWNPNQPTPYQTPQNPMAYGHPQPPTSQQPQRQPQTQAPTAAYRQHVSAGYPQQDPQKMQYPGQQAAMMGGMLQQQQGYGPLGSQQQPQTQTPQPQQRVPQQQYSQASAHQMYPNTPQNQPNNQSYTGYGPTPGSMQHQSARPGPQHVSYGQQLDQSSSYQQHMAAGVPAGHLVPGVQPQSQMTNQQNHLNPSHISAPLAGQSQSQHHPNQVVHPSQQQQQQQASQQQAPSTHTQNHTQLPGHMQHVGLQQQTQSQAGNQAANQQQQQGQLPSLGHPQQQQHAAGPGLMSSGTGYYPSSKPLPSNGDLKKFNQYTGNILPNQHQPPSVSQHQSQQQQSGHPIGQQLGIQMPHSHSGLLNLIILFSFFKFLNHKNSLIS